MTTAQSTEERRFREDLLLSFKIGNVFHDGDASTIDKAIAGSVIAHYVNDTSRRLRGNSETAGPNQFAAWYENWEE